MAGLFQRKHTGDDSDDDWMATYADAITLILCFFVIIISISEPSQEKFEEAKKAMMGEFVSEEEVISTPFETMAEDFFHIVEKNNLHLQMGVGRTERGVLLELSSGAFYQPGSAEFRPEALPILEEAVKSIVNFSFDYASYKVEVEGHTDSSPIHTEKFPSNWELAAARAARVVRFFADKGIEPNRLKAMGMGAAYPKVPNEDEFGAPIPENQELNRRVIIRIERKI